MTARIAPQGSRAQGATRKTATKLAAVNAKEKASPVDGEREPSARGL